MQNPAWLRRQLARPWVGLALVVSLTWGLSQMASQWQTRRQADALRQLAQPGDILMLSSTECLYCDRARRWLDAERIAYRECFVEQDAACAATFRALMAPGTPTFVVKGRTVVGMDKGRILAALQSSTS